MADDRRIITSSSIIPMENADTEEGVTKWAIMRLDLRGESVSKKLGGKDVASVSKEQWGDGWCSGIPDNLNWEDMDEAWQSSEDIWGDNLTVLDTPIQLSSSNRKLTALWIKNLGTEYLYVNTTDNTGDYPIKLHPGGGIYFKTTLASLNLDEIYVKCASGKTTEIEYTLND